MMGMGWAWLATGLLVLAVLGGVVLIAFAASRSASSIVLHRKTS